MEITKELNEAFARGKEKIKSVKLTYRNGGTVEGTILKLKVVPGRPEALKVVVLKSDPAKGERPKHRPVFGHLTALEIRFADGSVEKFDS